MGIRMGHRNGHPIAGSSILDWVHGSIDIPKAWVLTPSCQQKHSQETQVQKHTGIGTISLSQMHSKAKRKVESKKSETFCGKNAERRNQAFQSWKSEVFHRKLCSANTLSKNKSIGGVELLVDKSESSRSFSWRKKAENCWLDISRFWSWKCEVFHRKLHSTNTLLKKKVFEE